MDQGLDRTDLKILRLLQADGRLSNAEIAARVKRDTRFCSDGQLVLQQMAR